jgi:2-polyprenyl-6-hydroxyphenyl methylase/3-demethylubiquinone-9 3-methyltransferase
MSPWHDWLDWLGGYPFEVARPADIVDFFHRHGFHVEKLNPCGDGWASNEFIFRASAAGSAESA